MNENQRKPVISPNLPYLPEIGVIGLVPEEWGGPWMPRHHVLTRLAYYFNVVWINPAREWREVLFRRTLGGKGIDCNGMGIPGFSIYNPDKWLPKVYRPRSLAIFVERQRLRRAVRILRGRGCKKIVLYLWRPEFEPALDLIEHDLSCYHIDDEYTFSEVEKPIEENEARLISRVDKVFIHSPALLEKKGCFNPQSIFVPNGVDYNAYATPCNEPADMKSISHPRIGYTGFIKKQLDWPLLLHLAVEHPEWSFVFIGPQSPHKEIVSVIQKLSGKPNVHFLGAKLPTELPAYTQYFDVCIMPYRMDDYTKYIYPLKLHEYLASGRPVIGTKIRSLHELSEVVYLANTPEEWSVAIMEGLSCAANTSERRTTRQEVARQHDWQLLVQQIAKTQASGLGQVYADRLEEAVRNNLKEGS